MAKKRRVSKKKISIAIIILLLIVCVGVGAYFFLNKHENTPKTVKIESVDTIEDYDYTLSSNATKYYKDLFKELKTLLESGDVDEAKYASLVAKLFVADFYNLDNKINKNDIGGTQFVYKDFREDFEKLATTSMYKSVENNLYNDRKQDLPVVANVSTDKKDNESFKYGDKTDDNAYKIDFEISYQEDLGYQTKGTLTLIHNDKKIEIAALDNVE
ncbi:MAG: hypothetical protein IJ093_03720 [Bacilli bacterium]|nr:hypothetical protein [Bacilli bacterium]